MSQHRVAVERTIDAAPSAVYAILRDYRDQHPKIMSPALHNLRIESGGVGAGTVFTVDIKLGGRTRTYRMRVEEPQPGHRLEERDVASSLVTAFFVQPAPAGGSIVRIETTWDGSKGIQGLFERLFAPRLMRKLYHDELERLDAFARSGAA